MPVVETVPGAGTMDHGDTGRGNGSGDDDSHPEEEDVLELQ